MFSSVALISHTSRMGEQTRGFVEPRHCAECSELYHYCEAWEDIHNFSSEAEGWLYVSPPSRKCLHWLSWPF